MAAHPPSFTPTVSDVYTLSTSKQVLVSKDPLYVRKDVVNGHYIGRQPENYMLIAILLCVLNPLCGPIALIFAVMSERAYRRADIRYAQKWASYSITSCMCIFIFTVILYIAIGFAVSPIGINGGHSFGAN
ncbi:uncharacterized protein LOC132750969 [Ruditapes philippinarum]|uniref:uncharacterized protein LOC132750969 n=1 Tax=Ruditapes philippinarum TaxID=129788 RepID=UPI00295AE527|nr:uncharacterized protein LOC132750969 [Ruditapes philippinarum]